MDVPIFRGLLSSMNCLNCCNNSNKLIFLMCTKTTDKMVQSNMEKETKQISFDLFGYK